MASSTSWPRCLTQTRARIYCDCLRSVVLPQFLLQQRGIGMKYLQKLSDAEAEWAKQASEIHAGTRRNLYDDLKDRGFIKDIVGTEPLLRETMRVKRVGAYVGVDPTAASLHLGHLVAFMPIFWMYVNGYCAFTLIGSSTAKIGDPSGRTTSRPIMPPAQQVQNLTTIHYQLKKLWSHVEMSKTRFNFKTGWGHKGGIVNNNAWWNKQSMLEVLSLLGSERLGPLLGRDNVKKRIQDGSGMSFAEFCYPMMQAWDWYMLLLQRGVQLQIGGSDQFGNILTGVQAVKACNENQPDPAKKIPMGETNQLFGFTVPLLTDSAGNKFGKSTDSNNTVWLDAVMTSPYDLYGYLVRRPDDEVERLLKLLTFCSLEDIETVMATHATDPSKRVAQHLLAGEVVWLIHGDKVANDAKFEHRARYGAKKTPEMGNTSSEMLPNGSISDMPKINLQLPSSLLTMSLARIMYAAEMSSSVSDANRAIKANGVYLGGNSGPTRMEPRSMNPLQLVFLPVRAWDPAVHKKFLIDGKILLLRKGKHNVRCIEFIPDQEWEKQGKIYPGQPNTGAYRKLVGKIQEMSQARKSKVAAGQLAQGKTKIPLEELEIAPKMFLKPHFNKFTRRMKEKGVVEDNDDW